MPRYCHRLVSVNANEVSHTCTLWVPIFINGNSISQRIPRFGLKPWLGQSYCILKSAITIPIQEMETSEKLKQLVKTF